MANKSPKHRNWRSLTPLVSGLTWGPESNSLWERKQNQAKNTSILTFWFFLFLLVNAGLQSSLLQGKPLFNSPKNNHTLLWRTPLYCGNHMMWDLFQSNKHLRGARVPAGNRQVQTTGWPARVSIKSWSGIPSPISLPMSFTCLWKADHQNGHWRENAYVRTQPSSLFLTSAKSVVFLAFMFQLNDGKGWVPNNPESK